MGEAGTHRELLGAQESAHTQPGVIPAWCYPSPEYAPLPNHIHSEQQVWATFSNFGYLTMHGDGEGHLVNFSHLQESNWFSKFLPRLQNFAPLMEVKINK